MASLVFLFLHPVNTSIPALYTWAQVQTKLKAERGLRNAFESAGNQFEVHGRMASSYIFILKCTCKLSI